MRILIVDTCYPDFLAAHYRRHRGLARCRYREQWESLMAASFGTSDAYSHFLGALGHTAQEYVVNCAPLQRAWAREHGIRPPGSRRDLLLAQSAEVERPLLLDQAEVFDPDVVYVQDLSAIDKATSQALSARGAFLVGQLGTEAPAREQLALFDLVVTSFPHFVGRVGRPTEYLPLGFDRRLLDRVSPRARDGAVFVGSLRRSPRWSSNELIAEAAEIVPIAFWGYGAEDWDRGSAVRRNFRGPAWGLEMYEILAGAAVAVNRHGDVAEAYANNMRLYEATGMGALLITDAKQNLGELFRVGEEVLVYQSADDLARLVKLQLADAAGREAIARAGQRRTLADHGYERRMGELVAILERWV